MLKPFITKLIEHRNLTLQEAEEAASLIMDGKATPSQIASLLTALRMKGETIDEITGFARQMRAHAVRICPRSEDLVDTCGTGGDVSHTFNISTVSAIVAAAAGVKIAKHGNRSVSSKCGSADLLESLGVKLDIAPKKIEESIDTVGFGFIFAPAFHTAMKHVMPSRREMGIRTIFNILGPLTNPAGARSQILGVFDEKLTDVMAEVLHNLGTKEALIVHGMDGLDEISVSDRTKVSHLKNGKISDLFISPEELGIERSKKEALVVHDIEEAKLLALTILSGDAVGPRRNVVVLNSAAAIQLGGLAKDLKEGMKMASAALDSKRAKKKLDEIVEFSRS